MRTFALLWVSWLSAGCLAPVDETTLGAQAGGAGSTAGGSSAAAGVAGGGQADGGGGQGRGGGQGGGGAAERLDGVTCSSGGFCWEGTVFGGTFHGVWGTSASFVVAVGEGGVLATFDGATWKLAASPTRRTLRAVWFSSPALGWAVGDGGALLEWNGEAWREVPSGTTADLLAIHGAGDTVFIGGNETLLTRREGRWTRLEGVLPVTDSPAIVRTIAVESASSVFIAGSSGGFFFKRFDGAAWRDVGSPTSGGPSGSDQLFSLSVCGGTLVASGNFSGEFHASWARRDGVWTEHFAQGARSVCLSATTFLSFGSSYFSNEQVQLVDLDGGTTAAGEGPVQAAFASGPRDVFLVGAAGLLARWTGGVLTPVERPTRARVFPFSADNVWRLVDGALERRSGEQWGAVAVPGEGAIDDVFSPAVGEVWVLRRGVAHHLRAGRWTRHGELPEGTSFVRGASADEVWFSGGVGAVSRWDGQELISYFVPTRASTGPMHVTATQVWVPTWTMDGLATTFRRVSGSWVAVPGASAWRLAGVGDDVFFTSVGALSRWRDGVITEVVRGTSPYELAATSSAVYAVTTTWQPDARRTSLLRVGLDGAVTPLDTGTTDELVALRATLDGHVWLSTRSGGVLHRAP